MSTDLNGTICLDQAAQLKRRLVRGRERGHQKCQLFREPWLDELLDPSLLGSLEKLAWQLSVLVLERCAGCATATITVMITNNVMNGVHSDGLSNPSTLRASCARLR